MILAAIGMCLATMVGPLDETPMVRISRPGGGGPEFIRQRVAGERESGGGIVLPSGAGGGAVTVVGASDESTGGYVLDDLPMGLRTDQLLRAFGYDRGYFGYTTINYPGRWGGAGGWGGHRPHHPPPPIDPRIPGILRDLAPIESRFPPVPGR